MVRMTVLLVALACATPSMAASCYWHGADGDRIDATDWLSFKLSSPSGTQECSTSSGGTGVAVRMASCDDGYQGSLVVGPDRLGGKDEDAIVVVYNEMFYKTCPKP